MSSCFFTYRLKWSSHDVSYYGVRYKEGEDPSSLMTRYFTSSKYVKSFIEKNGLPDVVEIRKVFTTKSEAKRWEERVISKGKLYLSTKWLNKGNNHAFRDVVMDHDIKQAISRSKLAKSAPRGKRRYCNDGETQLLIKVGDTLPIGFAYGKKGEITPAQQKHYDYMADKNKNRSVEEKKEIGRKISAKLKGKKKPDGFGERLSKATKGKPKLWARGDGNPSKRADVKEKISKAWENRETGKWFYHPVTKEELYAKESEYDYNELVSNGFIRGKPPTGKWYNNGTLNIWVRNDSNIDTSGLVEGKIYSNRKWITNGVESKQVGSNLTNPEGWYNGRTARK